MVPQDPGPIQLSVILADLVEVVLSGDKSTHGLLRDGCSCIV